MVGNHQVQLFAEDHFAGLGTGESDFAVGVVGGANVDGINIVAFDDFAPIGFHVVVAPGFGEGFGVLFVASADDLEVDLVIVFEEMLGLKVGVGVGLAHESVTDDCEIDRF